MSKKRPGVEAAIRLVGSCDTGLWEQVEKQYECVRSEKLLRADCACSNISGDEISKDELMNLVQWKFAVGKPRPQNLGLLRSNTEDAVAQTSREAIKIVKEISVRDCAIEGTGEINATGQKQIMKSLEELTKLKGVGPATATAILCRYRPELMCYMYDEVIDTFEPKRAYTMKVYVRVNAECLKLAKSLGKVWTTARVAKVLWIASRVLAAGGDDLTASTKFKNSQKGEGLEDGVDPEVRRKRRRKNL